MMLLRLLVVLTFLSSVHATPCPCEQEQLCNAPNISYHNEVLAFSSYFGEISVPTHWKQYQWNKITTIVAHSFPDYELSKVMCHAHSVGTKIVFMASYPTPQLLNTTYRTEWVQQQLTYIQTNHLDGINIDYEDALYDNQTHLVDAYTATIAELYHTLKAASSSYQISIDASWAPFCNDSTMCYNYKALSEVTDFIFTMSYDEQSQIFGPCVASANAGIRKTSQGIKEFLQWGISPRKLVLGVPWYGYTYKCLHFYSNNTCFIEHKKLRTSNCSDIAGKEISYSIIVSQILPNSLNGRLWSTSELSPYANYISKDDNSTYQVWYDDVTSTGIKYDFAHGLGLRGVGMWAAESLDYSRQKDITDMWGVLPDYKNSKV